MRRCLYAQLLGKPRTEDPKFKASLGYSMNSRPDWAPLLRVCLDIRCKRGWEYVSEESICQQV